MKKFLCALLLALMLIQPALGEAAKEAPASPDGMATFEGAGCASAEDAVRAYVDALRAGDVRGMLATFAIETYAAHTDAAAMIERLRSFQPTTCASLPHANAYAEQIVTVKRYAELANLLYFQYLCYSWPESHGSFDGGIAAFHGDEAEIDDFVAGFGGSVLPDALASCEIVEFMDPDALSGEIYGSETNRDNLASNARVSGCDELIDLPVKLRMGGQDYLLCLQCARYGERWYNFQLGGNLAALLGIDPYHAGLIPLSELAAD